MMTSMGLPSRRRFLETALAVAAPAADGPIDTHIHLFDPARFPYHANATYHPPAQPLEPYLAFAAQVGLRGVVIVHPEPYQDDHRYLEYCFDHEPRPNFFKGTCLFDPVAPDTPKRMEALVRRHPRRFVALRIHKVQAPGSAPTTSGPIKDRDLRSPAMLDTWAAASRLRIGVQMHFVPGWAPQIAELASRFPDVLVILDHLARAAEAPSADYEAVLKLARHPRVVMKYSAVNYSSRQPFPHRDAIPLVRRVYDAFGPERIVWGGLGHTRPDYDRQVQLFAEMFAFASEADRARIRAGNAARFFAW
jgi:predicted TIM-barrel fold metal-dependent hydrolase